jgi:hypothetical protein
MATKNEDMLKLRLLSEKLCLENHDKYKDIVLELKALVDDTQYNIDSSLTPMLKIKCYESMCSTIKNILKTID